MPSPAYNKNNRRRSYEQLPKGAYVLRIMGARWEENKSGNGRHITIAFDIAEGEYKDFYGDMFAQDTREDKKWPNDATYYLTEPADEDPVWMHTSWDSFFADLEDSNNGFVFNGDVKPLKGKIIGGKFRIEQSEYNGKVYDHTRLWWTCVAEDVRKGKAGALPNDKLISDRQNGQNSSSRSANNSSGSSDFMQIPDGAGDEIPF